MGSQSTPSDDGAVGASGPVGAGWVELADGWRGRWSDDGAPPALSTLPPEAVVVRSGAAFEQVRAATLAAAPWPRRMRHRFLGDDVPPAAEYVVLLPRDPAGPAE